MKSLKISGFLVVMVVAGVGVGMAVTNPHQATYDEYAVQKLTAYLKDHACNQAPNLLNNLLQAQCADLLEGNQAQLKEFISNHTERQNFVLLSVYKTDLSLKGLEQIVPSYHFETVGLFHNFYTYRAQRNGK